MRRDFHYLGELTEDGLIEHDRDEVRQALLDLEGAVYQLGGIVTMSAVRQQTGENAYVTTGVVLMYDSYTPAVKDLKEGAVDGAADAASS